MHKTPLLLLLFLFSQLLTATSTLPNATGIQIHYAELFQCPHLNLTFTSTDPVSALDLLYTPINNASIAAYGPGSDPSENEVHCYCEIAFTHQWEDEFDQGHMRVNSTTVQLEKVKLDQGVDLTVRTFLSTIGGIERVSLSHPFT